MTELIWNGHLTVSRAFIRTGSGHLLVQTRNVLHDQHRLMCSAPTKLFVSHQMDHRFSFGGVIGNT